MIRTGIELAVLAAGFALGGGVGVGTVLYAVAIGPLAQFFLRVFAAGPQDTAGAGRPGIRPAARRSAGPSAGTPRSGHDLAWRTEGGSVRGWPSSLTITARKRYDNTG